MSIKRTVTAQVITGVLMILAALAIGVASGTQTSIPSDMWGLKEAIAARTPHLTTLFKGLSITFTPVTISLLGVVAALLVWLFVRSWRQALFILLAVGLSGVFTKVVKKIIARERPPKLDQLIQPDSYYSFPSGHSVGITAFCVSLAIVICLHLVTKLAKFVVWFATVLLIVGVLYSRVYLGVHWPGDVFAGSLIGLGTTLGLTPLVYGTGLRTAKRVVRTATRGF